MVVASFDTLKYSKALREAGVAQQQADAQAMVLSEAFSLNLRELNTKDDLKHAVETVEGKLREAEQRIDSKLEKLDSRIDLVRAELAYMKWLMGIIAATGLGLLVRLFFFGPK